VLFFVGVAWQSGVRPPRHVTKFAVAWAVTVGFDVSVVFWVILIEFSTMQALSKQPAHAGEPTVRALLMLTLNE